MSIKVVELFAGVGGFRVGLENASSLFETIWANQWEPSKKVQWAYDCYIKHFGTHSCINENIHDVKNGVPKHDLLVGGFPCQDYSVASTGAKGIEGKKGVLWWDIRDIIEKQRPKYILLENVDRLLKSPTSQRGRDFGIILKSLNDLGYCVEWRVVNAADYGGAQRRRRTFIFAYHKKTIFFKSLNIKNKTEAVLENGFFAPVFSAVVNNKKKPSSFEFNEYSDLAEMSEKFYTQFLNAGICYNGTGYTCEVTPVYEKPISLSKILEKKSIDESFFLTGSQIKKFEYLRGSKKIERIKPNGEVYYYSEGGMSPYDSRDLPARTMLTSEGSVNRSTHIVQDTLSKKLRFLTPRECDKINGFPEDWTNTGMPQKFRYFCMGNALVVPMITRMGKRILEIDQI